MSKKYSSNVMATIHDRITLAKIIAGPSLGVGEAYMDEGLVPLNGSIHDLLSLLMISSLWLLPISAISFWFIENATSLGEVGLPEAGGECPA